MNGDWQSLSGLIDVTIKGVIILSVAALVVMLMRRRSAAARHLVWALALLATLALPVFTVLLPGLRIGLLAPTPTVMPQPIAQITTNSPQPPVSDGEETRAQIASSTDSSVMVPSVSVNPPIPTPDVSMPMIPTKTHSINLSLSQVIVLMWTAGSALVVTLWLAGFFLIWRFARRASVVEEGAMHDQLARICDELKLRRSVKLLMSPRPVMPLAWGIFYPRLLLPCESAQWPVSRLRGVLLHELGHIQRWDCATQSLGLLACALHWFNPLAWLAARHMRIEQELACDDIVLGRGQDSTDYAEDLLSVARQLHGRRWLNLMAVSMARPSNLRARITSILDSAIIRKSPTRRAILLTAVAAILLLLPLSAMHLGPRKALAQATSAPSGKTIDLSVTDATTHQPLTGATVATTIGMDDLWHGKTGADGHVTLPVPESPYGFSADIKSSGHIPQTEVFGIDKDSQRLPISAAYSVAMQPGTRISGKVVDEAGKPVGGGHLMFSISTAMSSPKLMERFDLWFVDVQADANGTWQFDGAPADLQHFQADAWDYRYVIGSGYGGGSGMPNLQDYPELAKLRDGSATFALKNGTKLSGVVNGPDGKPLAGAMITQGADTFGSNGIPPFKTPDDGNFNFQFTPGSDAYLTVRAKDCAPELKIISIGNEPATATIQLSPAKTLTGTVTDSAGKPIANAEIFGDTWREHRTLSETRWLTDKDGKFTWPDAPADAVQFDVMAEGFMRQQNVPFTAGQPNVVKLMTSPHVTGTVTDADTGKPINGFHIQRGTTSGDDQPVSFYPGGPDKSYDGSFTLTLSFPYPGYAVRVTADGYAPGDSRVFKADEGEVKLDIKLKKAQAAENAAQLILQPDGKPAAGAMVIVAAGQQVQIMNELGANSPGAQYTSAADGRVNVAPQSQPYRILVLHDTGTAEMDQDPKNKTATIQLQAWGKIHGKLMIGSKPGVRETIWMSGIPSQFDPKKSAFFREYQIETGVDGVFDIPRVPPGNVSIGHMVTHGSGASTWGVPEQPKRVTVAAGQTIDVQIGGMGRAVIGKVQAPPELAQRHDWEWANPSNMIMTRDDSPATPWPDDVKNAPLAQRMKWYDEFLKTDAGKKFNEAQNDSMRMFPFSIAADGTYRAEDVPEGKYMLCLYISAPGAGGKPASIIANAFHDFTIDSMPGGRSDEPLDLGTINMRMMLNPGDAAPDFSAQTLDGKTLKLSDYHGKYVLLQFWDSNQPLSNDQTANLKAIKDTYGNDIELIGVSFNEKIDDAKAYVAKSGVGWPQIYQAGHYEAPIATLYQVRVTPSIWLIGPDGKLIANNLWNDAIAAAVKKAIGH